MPNRLNIRNSVTTAPQLCRALLVAAVLMAGAQFCLTSPALAADAADPAKARAGSTMVVPFGVTARDVAADHAPAGVSQEQMLVALQRFNTNAFAGGNINRLLAGALLVLPSAEQALQVSEPKAKQLIAAQGREFNAQQLQAAPAVSSTEAAPQPAAIPVAAEAPATPAVLAPDANLPPTPSAAASEPSGTVATPATAAPMTVTPVNPTPTGLISQLIDHPAVLPATAGLLALMAALAMQRSRQRRQLPPASADASLTASSTPEAKFDPRLNAGLLAGDTAVARPTARAEAPATTPIIASTHEVPAALLGHFKLDLSLGQDAPAASSSTTGVPAPSVQSSTPLGSTQPVTKAKPAPEFDLASISLDLNSGPFNMGSISLDLGESPKPPPPADKATP